MVRNKIWPAIGRTVAPSLHPARLLLALKTAIAAGLAWPIAQLLPTEVDDYSYYAPLGALISMMPTLMGSLRSSLQTVIGLALGIGLAGAVLATPLPSTITVPLAVGIGIVLGGLRGLGAGRDYVAIAALFVLVVGGAQAEDFSVGYLVQMGVGMAIGFIVNFTIVPPLRLQESADEISALRGQIAQNLESMSEALVEKWPPEHEDWFNEVKSLDASIWAAEPVIEEAYESRRINPRARRHTHDVQEDFDDLDALTTLGRHTRELGETISSAIWSDPVPVGLPDDLREPLSAALATTAALIRAWNEHKGTTEAMGEAEEALEKMKEKGRTLPPTATGAAVLSTTIFTLRRMLTVLHARTAPPSA